MDFISEQASRQALALNVAFFQSWNWTSAHAWILFSTLLPHGSASRVVKIVKSVAQQNNARSAKTAL